MSALQVQITQTGAVLDQLAQTYETDSTQLSALQAHEASIVPRWRSPSGESPPPASGSAPTPSSRTWGVSR